MITKEDRLYKENGEVIKLPSVTGILQYYPKGTGFFKWLALNGWDESERIKEEAGKRGGNVHKVIEEYLTIPNIKTEELDLMLKQIGSIEGDLLKQFIKWWEEFNKTHKVKIISLEISGINKEIGYVGTIDLVMEIDGELWITDFKTSSQIYKSHTLQLSAYKHLGYPDNTKLALIHIKNGVRFIEVKDEFDIFLAVKKIHDFENDT
jgi:hypothetical protein